MDYTCPSCLKKQKKTKSQKQKGGLRRQYRDIGPVAGIDLDGSLAAERVRDGENDKGGPNSNQEGFYMAPSIGKPVDSRRSWWFGCSGWVDVGWPPYIPGH